MKNKIKTFKELINNLSTIGLNMVVRYDCEKGGYAFLRNDTYLKNNILIDNFYVEKIFDPKAYIYNYNLSVIIFKSKREGRKVYRKMFLDINKFFEEIQIVINEIKQCEECEDEN